MSSNDYIPNLGTGDPQHAAAIRQLYQTLFALRDKMSRMPSNANVAAQNKQFQTLIGDLKNRIGDLNSYRLLGAGSSSPMAGQGSLIPFLLGGFTMDNSVASQITVNWSALALLPSFLSQTNQNSTNVFARIPANSKLITGLTAGHTVYFYPYYNIGSSSLLFAAPPGSGSVGTPAIAYDTTRSMLAAQLQNGDGNIPLSSGAMSIAVTGGGGGGGTGGGSDCLAFGTLLISRTRGIIPIEAVMVGEEILSRFGWTTVIRKRFTKPKPMIRAGFSNDRELVMSATNPMTLAGKDSGLIHGGTISPINLFVCRKDSGGEHIARLKRLEVIDEAMDCVTLGCEPDNTFWANDLLNHNSVAPK